MDTVAHIVVDWCGVYGRSTAPSSGVQAEGSDTRSALKEDG